MSAINMCNRHWQHQMKPWSRLEPQFHSRTRWLHRQWNQLCRSARYPPPLSGGESKVPHRPWYSKGRSSHLSLHRWSPIEPLSRIIKSYYLHIDSISLYILSGQLKTLSVDPWKLSSSKFVFFSPDRATCPWPHVWEYRKASLSNSNMLKYVVKLHF